MLDISLNEVIAVLGDATKHTGHQYYFRCPACASSGGDTSGDNLLFNEKKRLLKCFACDDGAKRTLELINRYRRDNNIIIDKQSSDKEKDEKLSWWELNNENLFEYMFEANEEMPQYIKKALWQKYGIDEETIKICSIGYDKQPNMLNIGASVVFPIISWNHANLVGLELRQIDTNKKIIRHTIDTPSCLAIICQHPNANNFVICEGFKDAYCLRQLLKVKGVLEKFDIVTPAHGVSDNITENLKDVDFTVYSKCYLLLDNDKAGDKVTNEVLKEYPFFKDVRDRILKNYNDVAEMWMREYVETKKISK